MMLGIGNGIKRLAPFAPLLLLVGCGFHLSGAVRLPASMQATWLTSSEPRSDFYGSLSEEMRVRGLDLVSSRADAGATLQISEDITGRRILSVSALNIPREYEVYYQVTFSFEADGVVLISEEQLFARRNYTYDETQVLGKEREERIIRETLAEELARQVLRRIEAVSGPGNPAPA